MNKKLTTLRAQIEDAISEMNDVCNVEGSRTWRSICASRVTGRCHLVIEEIDYALNHINNLNP